MTVSVDSTPSPPQPSSPTSTASDSTPTSTIIKPRNGIVTNAVGGRMIKVIVVSDMICPWCYIGFKYLNTALSQIALENASSGRKGYATFEVEYRPYPLTSALFPSDDHAIEKMPFFEKKFGKEKAKEQQKFLLQKGEEVGIKFKFGGLIRRTYRAHRLLTLAYTRGGSSLQQSLLAHLFSAYFEKEEDIGSPSQLAHYACLIGLFSEKEEAEEWIKSNEGETAMKRLFEISQGCGITGVPFVVIDGRWAISGCQGAEEYYRVLEKLSSDMPSDKEIKENIPEASSQVCQPPPNHVVSHVVASMTTSGHS